MKFQEYLELREGIDDLINPWRNYKSSKEVPYPSLGDAPDFTPESDYKDLYAVLATVGKPYAKRAAFISAQHLPPHVQEVLDKIEATPGYKVLHTDKDGWAVILAGMSQSVDMLDKILQKSKIDDKPIQATLGYHRAMGKNLGIHPDAIEDWNTRILASSEE